jgi:hypothetical protein
MANKLIQKFKAIIGGYHIFKATITANIDEKTFRDDPNFFNGILSEKRYDLRQNLVKQINKEGLIHEKLTFKGKEAKIELTIKVKK